MFSFRVIFKISVTCHSFNVISKNQASITTALAARLLPGACALPELTG
jgi:hypothetical protein